MRSMIEERIEIARIMAMIQQYLPLYSDQRKKDSETKDVLVDGALNATCRL